MTNYVLNLGPDSGKRYLQMQQLFLQISQVVSISSCYHVFEWLCHLYKSQAIQPNFCYCTLHPPPKKFPATQPKHCYWIHQFPHLHFLFLQLVHPIQPHIPAACQKNEGESMHNTYSDKIAWEVYEQHILPIPVRSASTLVGV